MRWQERGCLRCLGRKGGFRAARAEEGGGLTPGSRRNRGLALRRASRRWGHPQQVAGAPACARRENSRPAASAGRGSRAARAGGPCAHRKGGLAPRAEERGARAVRASRRAGPARARARGLGSGAGTPYGCYDLPPPPRRGQSAGRQEVLGSRAVGEGVLVFHGDCPYTLRLPSAARSPKAEWPLLALL